MEPSPTQTVRALIEREGLTVVVMTLLRRFWKQVTVILLSAISVGKLIQQGVDVKESLAKIEKTEEARADTEKALATQYADINGRLTIIEGQWGALFAAAKIEVKKDENPDRKSPRTPRQNTAGR